VNILEAIKTVVQKGETTGIRSRESGVYFIDPNYWMGLIKIDMVISYNNFIAEDWELVELDVYRAECEAARLKTDVTPKVYIDKTEQIKEKLTNDEVVE